METKGSARARDIHTFSNHPRLPVSGQRPESAGNGRPSNYTGFQHTRPQTSMNHELPMRQKPLDMSPFLSAPDAQNRLTQSGRRPTGARLPTPPSGSNPVSTFEPPRQGKRLNLLNPMSLLARRRTSQAVTQLSAESLASSRAGNTFNESFDPRIKGTVVHDFSAPRPPPRKIVSTNDIRTDEITQNTNKQYQRSPDPQSGEPTDENGPWSGGEHTPVFTENFEEEQYPAAGPHVRKASDLSDLPLPQPPYAKGVPKLLDSDPTSKSNDKQYQAARRISARQPILDVPPPVPPKAAGQSEPKRISIDPSSTPPKPTVSSRKERSRIVSEVSTKEVIPKHMKSTSSRFSFDMIGAAEQERLLEDRHRQKALEKKNDPDAQEDEYEDDYDYDNMMEDDGLEEEIPMIGDDYDEEDVLLVQEEEIPGVNVGLDGEEDGMLDDRENIAGLSFQQSSMSPLSPYSPGIISTPRDANGDVIGFAMTKNSPYVQMDSVQIQGKPLGSSTLPKVEQVGDDQTAQGLGLQGIDTKLTPELLRQRPHVVTSNGNALPPISGIDEDDLYFDDGIIDELGDGDDGVEFDESVFDNVDTDQYGRPLKAFSSLPTLYSPPNLTADPSPSVNKIIESNDTTSNVTEIRDDAISSVTIQSTGGLAPQASVIGKEGSRTSPPMPGLTQDTLAAYQEALAAAAFSAAANGKFRRDSTPPNPTPSEQEDLQPDLIPDSSHTSRYEPFSPSYEDDFDYDDALEDDPIIAAANAEALAYDTDGFYGQEFGFYSAPAAGEAEYANGGYFGPRGVEGINRSQSGRVVSREPNLTPITERSEYSNRNSMMSMSMYGPGPGSVASPGLAQLAGLMSHPDYDGDMSLNALLKLRRGAWGGSQASLHSSTGSPRSAGGAEDTSPVGQLPPWQQGGGSSLPMGGHRRANSAFSLVSETPSGVGTGVQSENNSAPASPTLRMAVTTSLDTQSNKEGGTGFKKHRYTGSADSFSYLKEEDPQSPTGERWVLERRRTSELGEEILAREVVSGGRI